MISNTGKKSRLGFFLFMHETLKALFGMRRNTHVSSLVILRQILFTGYEALPLISFIALGIGGLIIMQGYNLLSNFGQGIWVHIILVTVVVNELSSIITALVVIARSGTAISTELGNMVVNREIDLLKSFGVSPISYLVVSRLLGVMLAMLVLTVYFNIIAVLGGWFFSSLFSKLEFRAFMNDFLSVLKISDIIMSLFKPLVFGFIIALVSSYQGMQVYKASTEVPQRTIRAVVNTIFFIIVADLIITFAFRFLFV
jgi:phospholipid/cholesterol/gamma-HCH transport system permease protein